MCGFCVGSLFCVEALGALSSLAILLRQRELVYFTLMMLRLSVSCVDPEGGLGVWTPPPLHQLKNHKAKGFLRNTGPDLLKNHKATKPAFNVAKLGHYWSVSETMAGQ